MVSGRDDERTIIEGHWIAVILPGRGHSFSRVPSSRTSQRGGRCLSSTSKGIFDLEKHKTDVGCRPRHNLDTVASNAQDADIEGDKIARPSHLPVLVTFTVRSPSTEDDGDYEVAKALLLQGTLSVPPGSRSSSWQGGGSPAAVSA